MSETRIGDWMQLVSGRPFWPFDPRPEEVHIDDIAHSLSLQCRFAGHCREFYSVAQHCVLASYVCDPGDELWTQLHDGAEAYVVDLPRPVKRHPRLSYYGAAEARCQYAICQRFGLPCELKNRSADVPYVTMPASVCRADEILLMTEARDLMGNGAVERWTWSPGIRPLSEPIVPWSPEQARSRFLDRFAELMKARVA